jgi:copper transport protein
MPAGPTGPTGPVSQTTRVGPIGMRVTVDPAIAGANELRLALTDRHGGHPFAASREIQVTASLPERHIGPLPVMLHRDRAGRYASMSLQLAPAGAWRLQITDRVSEFDQYTTTVRVPVR